MAAKTGLRSRRNLRSPRTARFATGHEADDRFRPISDVNEVRLWEVVAGPGLHRAEPHRAQRQQFKIVRHELPQMRVSLSGRHQGRDDAGDLLVASNDVVSTGGCQFLRMAAADMTARA